MKNICSFFKSKKNNNSSRLEDLFEGDQLKYLSRKIILDKVKNLDGEGIDYSSSRFVHVVIIGADSLSLHIARQVALICHYPNFDDEAEQYRTIISIINPRSHSRDSVEKMKTEFTKITGNLMSECLWTCSCYNKKFEKWSSPQTKSFIDVEFEFVGVNECDTDALLKELVEKDGEALVSVINNGYALSDNTVSWLTQHCYQYYRLNDTDLNNDIIDCRIDIRRAMIINLLYHVGTHLKDICISDIYEIEKYDTALSSFCIHATERKKEACWNQLNDLKLKLSNVLCADCIDTKLRSKNSCKKNKSRHFDRINFECLAKSEHARWNVEKLILGYRTYSAEERYKDELLFADSSAMKVERKRMKNDLYAHVDICTCRELMRVDPDNFKYDCFLTLAVDDIKRVK